MRKTNFLINVLFLFFLNIHASENINNDIAESIIDSSSRYNIEEELMFSIFDIESNLHMLAICVVLENKKAKHLGFLLTKNKIKHKIKNYKKKKIVSIDPSNKNKAIKALFLVKKTGSLKYDLGLGQINKRKIIDYNWDEEKILTNVAYNVARSAFIIRGCMNIHKNSKDAIECYNKGEHGDYSKYDYFAKVYKKYHKLF